MTDKPKLFYAQTKKKKKITKKYAIPHHLDATYVQT